MIKNLSKNKILEHFILINDVKRCKVFNFVEKTTFVKQISHLSIINFFVFFC